MAVACSFLALPAAARSGLLELPLEDLLQLEVFTAARAPAPVLDTPAAVTVLRAEELIRSGADDVAEGLELAAGVESLHVTRTRRAIGIRGQNGLLSNKLLVMQDGRSLYSPLFSGTSWEKFDVPFEELDRVEIIRGPGATVWGSNAVHGIVNILTKPADRTQGSLVSTRASTEGDASVYARYGGSLSSDTHYRVHARVGSYGEGGTLGVRRPGGVVPEARDGSRDLRVGLRVDHAEDSTEWMLEAGAFHVAFEETLFTPGGTPPDFIDTLETDAQVSGAHVNLRIARDAGTMRQAFYAWADASYYDHPVFLESKSLTANADWQAEFFVGEHHSLSAGAGARLTADSIEPTPLFFATNGSTAKHQLSAFLQDNIMLLPDRWRLVVGSKIEYGYFRTVEVQPQARLLYTSQIGSSWWAAVSRATRSPTRSEREGHLLAAPIPGLGMPAAYFVVPNPDFDSEVLIALESGLRLPLGSKAIATANAFYHVYEGLRTPRLGSPADAFVRDGTLLLPVHLLNGGTTRTWGFELEADWVPSRWWNARAAFSFVAEPDIDTNLGPVADRIRTYMDLRLETKPAPGWEAGLWLRHNNSRRVSLAPDPDIRPWWSLELRAAWTPRPGLKVAVRGHNLVEPSRLEATSEAHRFLPTLVRRAADVSISWEF